jgi:hypothetical protein
MQIAPDQSVLTTDCKERHSRNQTPERLTTDEHQWTRMESGIRSDLQELAEDAEEEAEGRSGGRTDRT